MPPQKKFSYEATPGQLYSGITALGETFEGETKAGVEKNPDFVTFCKRMHAQFAGLGANAVFSDEQKEAINFLGWRLSPQELMSAVKGVFVIGVIAAIIVTIIAVFIGLKLDLGMAEPIGLGLLQDALPDIAGMIVLLITCGVLGVGGVIAFLIYLYPMNAADDERTRALTYVPEMVGYLIMSMKLVPNLEKSIEFSAKHGKGKVADDFKRLIWDFQIGMYSSISEGLDMMALHWGKYSTELKEALMKIRASVMEPSESKRYQILDKTMMDVLDSVKEKMGDYARSLNQPSVMLFYIGVLLPLLLVIILPIGSAFSSLPFATTPVLVFVYVIMIPLVAFSFAKNVIKKRPPTYEPPIIPDDFAGVPPKWSMLIGKGSLDIRLIAIIILVVGISASLFISFEGIPPKHLFPPTDGVYIAPIEIIPADKQGAEVFKDLSGGQDHFEKVVYDLYVLQITDFSKGTAYLEKIAGGTKAAQAEKEVLKEKIDFTSSPKNDTTKYIFWAGAILSIVGTISFIIFYKSIYKRAAQIQIIQMEDEFKESMYMIASRMGENKPVENALKQAKDFLPNLLISKRIFGKTVENIELMGLPLESAVFDPTYGAMRGIPSKILYTAMRLLVDSVNLGVEVASRTLMSLSLQMENMDKVNKALKDMVSDVTTTMQTMALFIAPMVLGITTALQKVVLMTLAGVVASPQSGGTVTEDVAGIAGGSLPTNLNSIFQVNIESFKSFATPLEYLIIIGTYVALIVIILTYFTSKIKEDNDLVFKINLAKALPIAMAVYLVTTIVANMAISMMMVR
ncbi:MAG: hypothetical protein WCI04_00870 [archaeon]